MSCGLWHQLGLPPPTPGQWPPSGSGWGCFSSATMRLKGPCRASCPLSSLGPFPAPQPLPPGGFSSGNLQTGFWDLSSSLTPEEHRMKYLLTFLSNSNRVYIHPEGAVPPPLPVPLAPALELLAPPLLGGPSSQAGPPLLTLHLRLALHYADPPGLEAFSSPSSPSPGCHPVGACRPAPPPGRGQCRGGRAAHTIFLPHPKGPWTREDPAAWEPVRPLWSDSQTGKGQTPRAPGPLPTSAPERRLFRRLFWAPSIPKDAACGGSPAHTQPPEPWWADSVLGPAQDAVGARVAVPVLLEMSRALRPLHQGQPLLRAWEVTRRSTSATFIHPLRPFLQPGPHPVSKRLLVSYRKNQHTETARVWMRPDGRKRAQ